MDNRTIGTEYENRAAAYLRTKGYRILEQNYRNRRGEIDLIAKKEGTICFVEVKYRSHEGCGSPLEAVDRRKQAKIRSVASFYRMRHEEEDSDYRFDVIAFVGEKMEHIINAF